MTRALLLLLLALCACAPALQDARPKLAVVNAPSAQRQPGLAEALVKRLGQQPEAALYGFSSASALRFQETHRDMSGRRAPLQAAFIARSQGAAYAVMVGFDGQRSLAGMSYQTGVLTLRVAVSGRVQAILVDPETAAVRGSFASSPQLSYVTRHQKLELPQGVTPESPEGRAFIARAADALVVRLELTAQDQIFGAALAEVAGPLAKAVAALLSA